MSENKKKHQQDLQKVNKAIEWLKCKAVDYGVPKSLIPRAFFECLTNNIQLYGQQSDEIDTHIRNMVQACLKAQNCLDNEIALSALKIISKNIHIYIESTDTYPKQILKMNPKELFEIVMDFEDDEDSIKIAAYALNQYIAKPKKTPKDPDEEESLGDCELDDWFDDEEEEDDENAFIDDK